MHSDPLSKETSAKEEQELATDQAVIPAPVGTASITLACGRSEQSSLMGIGAEARTFRAGT